MLDTLKLAFEQPLWLVLLPLLLAPFALRKQRSLAYSSLDALPQDVFSNLIGLFLKLLAAITICALVLGLAGLHKPAKLEERVGKGAQSVILFDTSTSMDTPYSSNKKGGAVSRVKAWGLYESKGQVARKLISEYAAERAQDLFAIFVFSRNPIPIMPLSNNQAVIQAAIKAGTYERGLGTTDLGGGLIRAINFFENQPFKGSRIVMLVSDGAAKLTMPVKNEIANLLKKHRVTLYWLYLRDRESLGLNRKVDENLVGEIAPEQIVNSFFESIGTPYRAFSADNTEALQDAIDEVNSLQQLPIRYQVTIPKQDLSGLCYGVALALLLLLLLAKLSEIKRWN